jgi:predicted nuclease with TOPRIM domain
MTQISKIKEENNITLNEYTILQAQQNDLNDRLNSIYEECRKAKAELSEYENTRLLNKQYTIERMNDFICELKDQINNTEKEQIENLRKTYDL